MSYLDEILGKKKKFSFDVTDEDLKAAMSTSDLGPVAPMNAPSANPIEDLISQRRQAYQSDISELNKPKTPSTMEAIMQLAAGLAPLAIGAIGGQAAGIGTGAGLGIGAGVGAGEFGRQIKTKEELDREERDNLRENAKFLRRQLAESEIAGAQSQEKEQEHGRTREEKASDTKAAQDFTREQTDVKGKYAIEAAKAAAQSKESIAQAKPKKGQDQADKDFGKIYAAWNAAGGYAALQNDLTKLQTQVLDKLNPADERGHELSGILTKTPILGEIATKKKKAMQENLASVVQKTLRATLGGQFAEREGRQLVERAFNPQLSDAENYRRVSSLLNELTQKVEATNRASQYFESTRGTLEGFESTGMAPATSGLTDEKKKRLEELRRKKGL